HVVQDAHGEQAAFEADPHPVRRREFHLPHELPVRLVLAHPGERAVSVLTVHLSSFGFFARSSTQSRRGASAPRLIGSAEDYGRAVNQWDMVPFGLPTFRRPTWPRS